MKKYYHTTALVLSFIGLFLAGCEKDDDAQNSGGDIPAVSPSGGGTVTDNGVNIVRGFWNNGSGERLYIRKDGSFRFQSSDGSTVYSSGKWSLNGNKVDFKITRSMNVHGSWRTRGKVRPPGTGGIPVATMEMSGDVDRLDPLQSSNMYYKEE